MLNAKPGDIAKRIEIIEMLIDLMMAEEIEQQDIVDCLDDWMSDNFNVESDPHSHKEIAEILIKIRTELVACVQSEASMRTGSEELNKLRDLNEKNRGTVAEMSKFCQEKKKQMDEEGSDSSGFESLMNDSQCESVYSSDEEMTE